MNRVTLTVIISLLPGCGGAASDSEPGYASVFSQQPAPVFPLMDGAAFPDGASTALCMDAYASSWGKVVLVTQEIESDTCYTGPAEREPYEITKDEPFEVVLYGVGNVYYCIGVERLRGYITVSHERGTVSREEDLFTWCIAASPEPAPDSMVIRAFTETAELRLVIP